MENEPKRKFSPAKRTPAETWAAYNYNISHNKIDWDQYVNQWEYTYENFFSSSNPKKGR